MFANKSYFTLFFLMLLAGNAACSSERSSLAATTSPINWQVETLADELHRPWSIGFIDAETHLVTLRRGQLLIGSPGHYRPVANVPEVYARGQGGLFDVLPAPDFADSQRLYLSYAKPCDGGDDLATTAIARGTLRDDALHDVETIFVAQPCESGGRHFGGRLLFDNAGMLYLTTGDRGERQHSQRTSNTLGALVRLHADGTVPDDNPLVDQPERADALWSWGHRNAQGLALHPDSGDIWLHEHGPRGGDEINLIQPGLNYGWPVVTHGREYYGPRIGPTEKAGFESPLLHWTPSIAPSGMTFVTSPRYPDWQGDILVGALAGTHVARVRFENKQPVVHEQLLADLGERIRDVRQGPDGHIYILTDSREGKVLRLIPPETD